MARDHFGGPARGIWRFRERMFGDRRLATVPAVTMGEGDTPLVPLTRWGATVGLRRVWAKLEGSNPTGSYKDRGMSVLVSIAVANGATHLVEDSSGNAGAAAGAYAARAGITCTVYAPESAPAAKLRQIRAYGADLIAVPGPRSAVADAARLAGTRPGGYHVSHNDNPLFTIGNQSLAFEIAEARAAIDDRTLDDPSATRPWHVVMPVGGGALLCGVAEGFALRGAERNSPLLHGAQTTACAPLAEAYRAGSRDPSPIVRRPTMCGGIEIEQPARGRQILEAVRATGGSIVANDDTEILAARDAIATLEGIYIEPTSAACVAAVALLAHQAKIAPDDLVVLILTGSGLKDPGPIPR